MVCRKTQRAPAKPTRRSRTTRRTRDVCLRAGFTSAQVGGGGRGGEEDGEDRALAGGAVDQDAAVMRLDDAVGNRESEPDTLRLVLEAEEGVEDPLAHLLRDSPAAVGDGELDGVARDCREGDLEVAARGHRLDRVLDQVRDHLLDLDGIALRLGNAIGEVRADADLPLLDLLRVELEGGSDGYREGELLADDGALLVGELAQVGDDLRHLAGLLLDLLDDHSVRGARPQLLAQEGEEAGDGGERAVQLVWHAGAERAERGGPAGAQDLVLRRLQLRGPLVDTLLQLRVPGADLVVALLDLERHVVEGGRELSHLVRGLDVGAGVVAAFGERLGRLRELADGIAQSPRKNESEPRDRPRRHRSPVESVEAHAMG